MPPLGYIPVDKDGTLIMGGTRRFKFYAYPALALASSRKAFAVREVWMGLIAK